MYKIILLLLFLLFFNFEFTFANNFVEKTIDGYKFRYIKYDTLSKDYIFKIGVNSDYKESSLRELMEKTNGISAINGVYFCPDSYSECGGKNFTHNERYVSGYKIGNEVSTKHRVVFSVDKNNNPFLFQTDKINEEKEKDIFYGFSNFPLLLLNGESKYNDYVEMGLIDYKMNAKMQRNFICSTEGGRFIYSGYVGPIELEKVSELLLKIGCYNAINLDAGGSSAFIYNGRYIIGPGRDIMDGVIIERKGLDTKKIIDNAIQVKNIIETKLQNKSFENKTLFLQTFTDNLDKKRKEIYEKNSRDLFDYTSGEKNGYEINIKSIKTLENVYFINYLNKLLYELEKSY